MKRLMLTILIAFMFTFNGNQAKTLESENVPADYNDNVEQSQDQEEFYQMDEDELKQMGYEVQPQKDVEKQESSSTVENEEDSVSLDSKPEDSVIPPLTDKLFILGVEKQKEYGEVGAVNMFWDKSKNFTNTYYQDFRNTLPMPILLNSSYIMNQMDAHTKVYVGQSSLGGFNDLSIGFVRANETTYDNGARIVTNSKKMNFTAGVYDSTLTHNLSGGAVISSNPIKVNKIKGSFIVGGGYYTNELDNDNKNTAGIFGQYRLNRFKLNLQAAKSKYANSNDLETGLYFTPEFQLTDSISIKTRFIKNISQDTDQNEFGLTYKPLKNNPRDLELEFGAANTYSEAETNKPKFRFSAKFKV